MELDIRIIQHNDFLKTTASGVVDMVKSKQVLLKLASLNKPPNNREILIDVRGTTDHLTAFSIAELVELMIKNRDSFRNKIAILTDPGPRHELAKFMELYAGNRNIQVTAFDNFEAAILWLATIIEVEPQDS